MKEKNKAKNILKEYATITVGMFIVSASVYYLMMPNSFVVGSISGLVMVLANFIPLKVSTMTMILNVALLIIGIVFVGKEFGGKTVITSLMLPVYLRIFETVTPDVPPLTDDMFINMLCHILVISIGQAILFNVNASSGGLDVVAKVLNKYLHFEIGKSLTIAGFVTHSPLSLGICAVWGGEISFWELIFMGLFWIILSMVSVSVRGCVSCQRNIRRSSSLLYMSCTEGRLFIRQSEDWAIRNRQKWLQFWKRVNMQSFLHLSMRQTRVRLLRYQLSVR